jgi:hypothetical protein
MHQPAADNERLKQKSNNHLITNVTSPNGFNYIIQSEGKQRSGCPSLHIFYQKNEFLMRIHDFKCQRMFQETTEFNDRDQHCSKSAETKQH